MTIALTDDRWQLFASHAVIAGSAEVDRYKRIINADGTERTPIPYRLRRTGHCAPLATARIDI